MEIEVNRVVEALCNMGYRVNREVYGFCSLDYPNLPDAPYNIVLDASRQCIPSEALYDYLEFEGVDITIFNQQLDAL